MSWACCILIFNIQSCSDILKLIVYWTETDSLTDLRKISVIFLNNIVIVIEIANLFFNFFFYLWFTWYQSKCDRTKRSHKRIFFLTCYFTQIITITNSEFFRNGPAHSFSMIQRQLFFAKKRCSLWLFAYLKQVSSLQIVSL